MNIKNVLAGVAVKDLDHAKRWYETFFGRPVDAEPMPGLAEWHTPGGVVQLVADEKRAGGSLVTVWVADAQQSLAELAARGGPSIELDTTTSEKCCSPPSPTPTVTKSRSSKSGTASSSDRRSAVRVSLAVLPRRAGVNA